MVLISLTIKLKSYGENWTGENIEDFSGFNHKHMSVDLPVVVSLLPPSVPKVPTPIRSPTLTELDNSNDDDDDQSKNFSRSEDNLHRWRPFDAGAVDEQNQYCVSHRDK